MPDDDHTVLVCCGTAVVQEQQVTSCNTPCSMLDLTCPAKHRLAIREVFFSVTKRADNATPCSVTQRCGTDILCCETSSVPECVFSYSPSHLEAVHRNCSGMRTCAVKTDRTEEESVACHFARPDETVSHTVMDYVCINESAIVDICTLKEVQVRGRTLFTMLDTARWRNPRGGAVCRCTAESARWPTTNTIAVFVVDMRLNMLREAHCSKADVRLKSGSITRHLDCESSQDPRQSFPFVALLNNSNVATVELVLHKKLPEIVWIGFESNEMEDIRLTCALQGYVPILTDEDQQNANASKDEILEEKSDAMGMSAIAGVVAGAIVLCVVIVLLVLGLVWYRKRQKRSKAEEYSEPHDTVDDIDVYYSTPDLSVPHSGGGGGVRGDTAAKCPGTQEDDGEVYVTAAAVRERKRQSTKKVVRVMSIPEISDDVAEYYASPWDIRDRRRLEEVGEDTIFSRPSLPPPLPSPTVCSEEEDDYAMLNRHRRDTSSAEHDQSYDHLPLKTPPGARKSQKKKEEEEQAKPGTEDKKDTPAGRLRKVDRPEPDGCNTNFAFKGDDGSAE
ncbi:hypothetical protein ACOMHN_044100 [Nucella lapillus]